MLISLCREQIRKEPNAVITFAAFEFILIQRLKRMFSFQDTRMMLRSRPVIVAMMCVRDPILAWALNYWKVPHGLTTFKEIFEAYKSSVERSEIFRRTRSRSTETFSLCEGYVFPSHSAGFIFLTYLRKDWRRMSGIPEACNSYLADAKLDEWITEFRPPQSFQ